MPYLAMGPKTPARLQRAILAALFSYAAAAKLIALQRPSMVRVPASLYWTGDTWVQVAAIAVELSVAMLLLSRLWYLGLCAASGLSVAFTVLVLVLHHNRIDVASCGCLGSQQLPLLPHLAL